jgi:hypothetical protein
VIHQNGKYAFGVGYYDLVWYICQKSVGGEASPSILFQGRKQIYNTIEQQQKIYINNIAGVALGISNMLQQVFQHYRPAACTGLIVLEYEPNKLLVLGPILVRLIERKAE